MQTQKILVEKIHLDPEQPREVYAGIETLADSMKNKGFLPECAITVRPHPEIDGEFMVVVGHRRTLAAKKAHLLEIDAFVSDGMNEREIYEFQLVENENREDLTAMNRARAIQKGIDKGIDTGRIAKIFGVSVATVKADLELCGLAPELHKFVDDGSLSKEVARKLATSTTKGVVWPGEQQMSVFNNLLVGKKTNQQLSAIEAYCNKQNQLTMDPFTQARKLAGENGGLTKARKASEKMEKAIADYEKALNAYGVNIINARKGDAAKLRMMHKSMKKIADKVLADLDLFDARTDLNAPKAVNG
jgi:ParB family transcriptional regulator, chromosome partitioning protein